MQGFRPIQTDRHGKKSAVAGESLTDLFRNKCSVGIYKDRLISQAKAIVQDLEQAFPKHGLTPSDVQMTVSGFVSLGYDPFDEIDREAGVSGEYRNGQNSADRSRCIGWSPRQKVFLAELPDGSLLQCFPS